MPMDKRRYPADWKAISLRIRERDGWRCKWCGVSNGAIGYRRASDGTFVQWEEDGELPEAGRPVRIVLTVAHLGTPHADGTPGDKHDKMDVRDENLAALCQACHLRFDIQEHTQNAARTRRMKRVAAGQVEMFDAR